MESTPAYVVVPSYNELENLRELIPLLLEVADLTVVIVDDNSPDGTGELVAEMARETERVQLIRREGKLGYGSAVIAGIQHARAQGASAIVTMDADLSHDPRAVPGLLAELETADMAIGSRYVGGIRILNWSISRLLLSTFANKYVDIIFRYRIADYTSGFRAYRAGVFERVDLDKIKTTGYAFLVEVLHLIKKKQFTVKEHPITYTERRAGQSKISKGIILESMWRPWVLKFFSRR